MIARNLASTACALALLAAVTSGASAQAPQTCSVHVDRTGGVSRQVEVGPGRLRLYAGGGVWAHCVGQHTTMYSDSVAWFPEFDRFDMVGHVAFHDSTVDLKSDRASYFLSDERLDAHGSARLVNLETGSLLHGPTITYYRVAPGVRDTSLLVAPDRPTVEYQALGDTAGAPPYVIVGSLVRLKGNSFAWASGAVTIDREHFAARADSAQIDGLLGTGKLIGHAHVTQNDSSASYHLSGRVIDYRLDGRQLTWVRAGGLADATSAEWHVAADSISFDIANDRIQGGAAWGDSTRPAAQSSGQTITADSLVIVAPDQRLTAVHGIGNARATTKRDSTDSQADWVAGDTVIARFDSTAAGRRVLAGIEASGAARARYRVFDAKHPDELAGINYSRGRRITARFTGDRLDRVMVVGEADGVYLQVPQSPVDSGGTS